MPKNLQKSLQSYLSKIKSTRPSKLYMPSKRWIHLKIKGCKHPRTPSLSFDDKNKNNDDEATLEDIDRFLFENFKSLYLEDLEETNCNNKTKKVVSSQKEDDEEEEEEEFREKKPKKSSRILFDSSEDGSNRFFLRRGFSCSMIDTTSTTTTNTCEEIGSSSNSSTSKSFNNDSFSKEHHMNLPNNCVVVLASSPNPYDDFRRSMEGMMDVGMRNNEKVDWDFMEELLFCHLNLNDKKSYKFILNAFCDLVADMGGSSETNPAKPRSVRTIRTRGR
ncbi:transcription repressor OFP14-like [Cicer arietinum]|uniref:Transcription repressor n=1 Tax=Cicer arietinum TaxID=3827 RepID=A0A3Q7XT08_CICAR|nr:transcription repressor OFP14-like [Cicer arietinum]